MRAASLQSHFQGSCACLPGPSAVVAKPSDFIAERIERRAWSCSCMGARSRRRPDRTRPETADGGVSNFESRIWPDRWTVAARRESDHVRRPIHAEHRTLRNTRRNLCRELPVAATHFQNTLLPLEIKQPEHFLGHNLPKSRYPGVFGGGPFGHNLHAVSRVTRKQAIASQPSRPIPKTPRRSRLAQQARNNIPTTNIKWLTQWLTLFLLKKLPALSRPIVVARHPIFCHISRIYQDQTP